MTTAQTEVIPHGLQAGALCSCYSRTENDGVIYPVFCREHQIVANKAIGHITHRYLRYFDTEGDAKDRAKIIRDRYPSEGYGTTVSIYQISRWWLVAASWGSAD